MFESFGRIGDAVQFAPRRFSCAGVKRQRATESNQLLRDWVRKAPFRQHQKRAFRFTFLFRAIAREKPCFHFQPGPGMRGKIMLRRPLRLAWRAAWQGNILRHWRGRWPLLQPQFNAQRYQAPIILRLPRQAEPKPAACARR